MNKGVIGVGIIDVCGPAVGKKFVGCSEVGAGEYAKVYVVSVCGECFGAPNLRNAVAADESVKIFRACTKAFGLYLHCPVSIFVGCERSFANDGAGVEIPCGGELPANNSAVA